MKFARQLEEYERPEWRGHYIPYRALTKQLESIAAGDHSKGRTAELWRLELRREAFRVGDFVDRGLVGLETQLHDLQKTVEGIRRGSGRKHADATDGDDKSALKAPLFELRVLAAVGQLSEGVARLRGFAELNHAALYKILKKHDKLLNSDIGLGKEIGLRKEGGLFKELVKRTRLAETGRMDDLEADLERLSMQGSKTEGLDASAEVLRLVTGIGGCGHRGVQPNTFAARSRMLWLGFFLGSSTGLFLCIGVLLALPAKSAGSFSTAYFLTPMPVFRVVFSVLLSLWCMGVVAWTCDRHDINHLFILNVDPRCRLNPSFFFSRAAALTTAWILLFGMYVVDYKWQLLPPLWEEFGYNRRARFHFVVYPVVLLAITFIGMLWPSKVCRNRYKMSVWRSVRRTVTAPWHPVTFADNIAGDVLTSVAKPLQDVPAALCYLASPHPQRPDFVERFVEKGDTCSHTTHHVILPLIAGMPYVFRAMQCLRRFHDTEETRHLWNFGKYFLSLLVVVVSSLFPQDGDSIFVLSTLCTLYMFAWDVALDWGLDRRQLRFWRCARRLDCAPDWHYFCCWRCTRRHRITSNSEETLHSAADYRPLESKGGGVQPVRVERMERPERQFSARAFWCCVILDLLARFAWVLTLMPSTIIAGSIEGRVVLVSAISSIEILRRSMWAVFRIEYEQVANGSGYRALLWVPSKLNPAACARTSERAQPEQSLGA